MNSENTKKVDFLKSLTKTTDKYLNGFKSFFGFLPAIFSWGKKRPEERKPGKSVESESASESASPARTWNEEWNAVFHHFIDRNATKLLRTYYAGLVRAWQKKPENERATELAIANKVIARLS